MHGPPEAQVKADLTPCLSRSVWHLDHDHVDAELLHGETGALETPAQMSQKVEEGQLEFAQPQDPPSAAKPLADTHRTVGTIRRMATLVCDLARADITSAAGAGFHLAAARPASWFRSTGRRCGRGKRAGRVRNVDPRPARRGHIGGVATLSTGRRDRADRGPLITVG
jgi:hypothetical protein